MGFIGYTESECAKDCYEFLSKLMRLDGMYYDHMVKVAWFSAKAGYFFDMDKVKMMVNVCNDYINLLVHKRQLLVTVEVSLGSMSVTCTRFSLWIKVNDYSSVENLYNRFKTSLETKVKDIFTKYGVMTATDWSNELVGVWYDKYYGIGAEVCISVPLCDERLNYGYINNRASSAGTEFRDELSRSILTELYDFAKKERFTIESRIAGIGYNSKKHFYADCVLILR